MQGSSAARIGEDQSTKVIKNPDFVINDGDLVLVRQQPIAEDGEIVVALIDDSATIKEFYHSKDVVTLKPKSKNKEYQPIILTENFQIQGVVVATIPL